MGQLGTVSLLVTALSTYSAVGKGDGKERNLLENSVLPSPFEK